MWIETHFDNLINLENRSEIYIISRDLEELLVIIAHKDGSTDCLYKNKDRAEAEKYMTYLKTQIEHIPKMPED